MEGVDIKLKEEFILLMLISDERESYTPERDHQTIFFLGLMESLALMVELRLRLDVVLIMLWGLPLFVAFCE